MKKINKLMVFGSPPPPCFLAFCIFTIYKTLKNKGGGLKNRLKKRYFIRYSAERACAVSPSPCASTDATLPSSDAPSAEQPINDERF